MTLIMNFQNMQHENGTLSMTKIMQNIAIEMKRWMLEYLKM